MEEVISAISTASGVGGVAIIRLSGNNALQIAQKMFKPLSKNIKVEDFEPYKMYVGEIDGGDFTDFGMAVYFKGPKSYTGEDMVEFHCHGGIAISQGILRHTFKLGAVPATRGEFTKRAFVNGKLSLDSCEGLIDMINSESVAGVKVGYGLYREKLYNKINELQNTLTNSLAGIDADIDYPEEDLEVDTLSSVKQTLGVVYDEVKKLSSMYYDGKRVIDGVKVAIVGKPNTGKSSLLNAILCYDKAIVSSVAGTTRDVVEGSTQIGGVKFNFYDTAGIRETADDIEKQGIIKAENILNSADIVLLVFDGSLPLDKEDNELKQITENKEVIVVYNKKDKFTKNISEGLSVSAKTGEGIAELKSELYSRSFKNGIDLNGELICEERHYNALKRAENALIEAQNNVGKVPLDFVAEDIKQAWLCLGEITGKTASEDIIDEIFSKFCVGK